MKKILHILALFAFLAPAAGQQGMLLVGEGKLNPDEVPGLTWWLLPETGITVDTSNGVSLWADQSGLGKDVSQSNASIRPKTGLSYLNGIEGITWEGGNDDLRANLQIVNSVTGEFTIFAVFSMANATSPFAILFQRDIIAGTYGTFDILANGGTNFSVTGARDTDTFGGPSDVTSGYGIADGYVVSGIRDATSIEAFYNGRTNGETITTGTPSTDSGLIYLGSRTPGTPSFDLQGAIYEVIAYDRALTPEEHRGVLQYINLKYNIF